MRIAKSLPLLGVINGSNKCFELPKRRGVGQGIGIIFCGGMALNQGLDFDVDGDQVTLSWSPDEEYERPIVHFI